MNDEGWGMMQIGGGMIDTKGDRRDRLMSDEG